MKYGMHVMLACAVLVVSGCSVKLKPDIPEMEAAGGSHPTIATMEEATGMQTVVGHGTMTVFALPVADVKVKDKEHTPNQLVMSAIRETLKAGGYEVVGQSEAAGPVLTVKVYGTDFSNYTWTFPIVPTWGKINMELQLVGADGVKWEKRYKGSSFNLYMSFSSAVNSSLEDILEQVAQDVQGEEFRAACCTMGAPAKTAESEHPTEPAMPAEEAAPAS